MNSKYSLRALSIFSALLLGCMIIIPLVNAEDISIFPMKDSNSDEIKLSSIEIPNSDGTVIKTQATFPGGISHGVKAVEIPNSWKHPDENVSKMMPSDQDWGYLRSIMTGLSDLERDRLLEETRQIYNGTSTLSREEQSEVMQQIGEFLVQAEKGDLAIDWSGFNGHHQISIIAGENLKYVTEEQISTLGEYDDWADINRIGQPPLPGLIDNRHSWAVTGDGWPGLDNYGPDSCEYFLVQARMRLNQYDADGAYIDIGKGLHYIEDLGCPFHTTGNVAMLTFHVPYEEWVYRNWTELEGALNVDEYYLIEDPSDAAKDFAWYSFQKIGRISAIMTSQNWESDPGLHQEMVDLTQDRLRQTTMWTMGMIDYVAKPDFIGVYKDGVWYLDYNADGNLSEGDKNYQFGAPGWTPIVGDWNGNGRTEIGVYKNGAWHVDKNENGAFDAGDANYTFGLPGWTPVIGDWDGNGLTKIGVYKEGVWYLDMSGDGAFGDGDAYYTFGLSNWTPVVGDWNGNGRIEIGVYKDGVWYLDMNNNGAWDGADKLCGFGQPGYMPVVHDWNRDGTTNIGVYSSGIWYLDFDGDGAWNSLNDKHYGYGGWEWAPVVIKWSLLQ